ncbi:hypothetical protein [Tahibacter sp.]|uniref:hypothetical protein n=1 Tax=Tahibacter sp. TaxID=2056211 RepID=UPI0028C406E9|nr:hypothetical protein [Tahibacter sp.]
MLGELDHGGMATVYLAERVAQWRIARRHAGIGAGEGNDQQQLHQQLHQQLQYVATRAKCINDGGTRRGGLA